MSTTGSRKAASMFVLLGEEAASEIMRHLSEDEIERLAKEISGTGPMSGSRAEQEAEDLYETLLANRFVSEGGVDYARRIVQKTLGSGLARRINQRLASNSDEYKAFKSLDQLDPIQLSQFLQHEHSQTIAVILSQLSSPRAATILASLPDRRRSDVAVRMATLEEVAPEVISTVAEVLESRLQPVGKSGKGDGMGGIRSVAEMFNRLDRKMSREVLEQIESEKPDISSSIRQVMFVFEDITLLDDLAVREVLQRVDKKTVAQALKGTDPEMQNHFFRNMSQRAVEIMREEMEIMGPIKTADVHRAQRNIVEVVNQLEEEGVISIGGGADEYVV